MFSIIGIVNLHTCTTVNHILIEAEAAVLRYYQVPVRIRKSLPLGYPIPNPSPKPSPNSNPSSKLTLTLIPTQTQNLTQTLTLTVGSFQI